MNACSFSHTKCVYSSYNIRVLGLEENPDDLLLYGLSLELNNLKFSEGVLPCKGTHYETRSDF